MRQLDIYWINVDLKFRNKVQIQNFDLTGKDYVKGVIMSFGITAENEDLAKKLLIDNLKGDLDFADVSFEIEVNDVGIIDSKNVQKEIYEDEDIADAILRSPYELGLWYRSGKAYYKD